ncbi:MAG: N-acetylglucosamine-6-phosphate deacetylase [Clostridia bacterium]|nr:N-acetylglucosamine-6-phosphate deacetylase [Clostridia bacterium]
MRAYINAKVIFENEIKEMCVITQDGKIKDVCEHFDLTDCEIIDCKGNFLSPGFADIHVHGGGGFSAMSDDSDEIVKMCHAHALRGTTSILPTTLAAPINRLHRAIDSITEAKNKCDVSNILGVHLEGPFISMDMKGAQSPDNILIPTDKNIADLLDYSKEIKIIGAAPEVEGGMNVGAEAVKRGIVASVAHSNADYSVIEKALSYGYSDVTHIYSACSGMKKVGIFRVAGVVEAGLSLPAYSTQFIADLRHLPYGVLKLIYQAKGADKAYAISDGLEYSALDMKDGTVIMQENGLEVLFEDNVMKLSDRSCLAGSVATSNVLVRNMYKSAGIPLVDAVKMASLTPLSVIGFDKTKGKIKENYDEDIIIFDDDINVEFVCVNGKVIKNTLS